MIPKNLLVELGQRSTFLTPSLRSFGKDRSRLGRLALVIDKSKQIEIFSCSQCLPGLSSAPLMAFISWRLPYPFCHCKSGCSGAIRGTTFPYLSLQLSFYWETRLLRYPE